MTFGRLWPGIPLPVTVPLPSLMMALPSRHPSALVIVQATTHSLTTSKLLLRPSAPKNSSFRGMGRMGGGTTSRCRVICADPIDIDNTTITSNNSSSSSSHPLFKHLLRPHPVSLRPLLVGLSMLLLPLQPQEQEQKVGVACTICCKGLVYRNCNNFCTRLSIVILRRLLR